METAVAEFDAVLNAFCPGEGARDNSCGVGAASSHWTDSPQSSAKRLRTLKDAKTKAAMAATSSAGGHQRGQLEAAQLHRDAASHHREKGRHDVARAHETLAEGHDKGAERFAGNAESSFEHLVANLGKPERRTLSGREFLVAPITIFPPGGGVMTGSKGALFYSDRVCAANLGGWNHIPITARHPVAANGKHVSAADPDVLDKQRLGFLLNDRMEDGKRRVDGWYDLESVRNYDARNGTRILNGLESGEPLEVSTGLLTDDSPAAENANHNGRAYAHEVRGWTPDHLAVLPDQVGACAIKDGCGVNNARRGVTMTDPRSIWQKLGEFLGVTSNTRHEDEEYHCALCEGKPESEHCDKCKEMKANAESFQNKQDEIQRLLTERFGKGVELQAAPSGSVYVSDLFDDSVVYQLDGVYYRLPYSGGDGKYVLSSGRPEKVDRKTNYVPANNARSLNTGKFKRTGSGYGRGEPHERAQAGAMILSDRDRELGADAKRQLAETGANPASWVADEATWERAKEAAGKTYTEGDDAYWPVVVHIYKNMGGEVKGTDNADDDFAELLANCDEGNESGESSDDSTFNERSYEVKGDSPMPLTEKQRKVIVTELTTNCACWRGGEDVLNELSDERLLALGKAHQRAQADEITANAVRDALKAPADLKANEMPAFIKKKIEAKEAAEEEEEDEDEKEEEVKESAATSNAIPAKPASFDEFLAMAPPEWKEAVANAVKITREQKAGIVRRLVVNVREEKARDRLAAKYVKMPLGELQDMLALVPQVQQRPAANEGLESYLGAAGSFAGNVLRSKEDKAADDESIGLMMPPTFNIEDARKTA